MPSAAAEGAAGGGAGGVAVFEDERAVDEDVLDAFGEGAAGGVGRAIGHGGGVEDGDIGDEPGAEQAAVGQAGTGARREWPGG